MLKIAVLIAVFACLEFFVGWSEIARIFKESSGLLSENPWLFLLVMGIGCALPFPITICYLTSGICFGLWKGFLLCFLGLFISSSIGGLMGKFLTPKIIFEKISDKFNLKQFGMRGEFNLNFFVRAIPGIPYWIQNVFLGGMTKSPAMYLIVCMSVQGIISFTVVFLASSLDKSPSLKYIALGAMVFSLALLQIVTNAVMKKNSQKKSAEKIDIFSPIKTVLWNMSFAVALLLFMLINVAVAPLYILAGSRGKANEVFSRAAQRLLSLLFIKFAPFARIYGISIKGLEFVEKAKSSIIVANHTSLIDPFLLLSIVPNLRVVLKKKYLNWTAIKYLVRKRFLLCLNSDSLDEIGRIFGECGEIFSNGANVAIFPEGKRSSSGKVGKFMKFAFSLSEKTGSEVIPVSIAFESPFLAKGRENFFLQRRTNISIEIFPPLNPKNFKTPSELSDKTCDIISRSVKKQISEDKWKLSK